MTSFAGAVPLTRVAIRRDRVMLPAWIYILTATVVSTAYTYKNLYRTAAERERFELANNHTTATLALSGRVFDSSIGGLTTWKVGVFAAVLVAVMSILIVVRHTRAEEEDGRLELVGSGVVGRHAPLTAALLVAFGANLGLALLVALGLIATGLPAAGAIALGLSLAIVGWAFAALAAVAAQLSESARTARQLSFAALGASYLLRAAGDAAAANGPSWLSWLSPLGWSQQIRAFGAERWWVFGLAVAFVAVVAGMAHVLVARRDLGAGLLTTRPGPAQAGPALRNTMVLAWRLHRGPLLAWTCGFAAGGVALGSIAHGIGDLIGGSASVRNALERMGGGQSLVDAYLAAVMGILGLLAAVYVVQATLRLRVEETGRRAEPVLATRVGRIQWAAGHITLAVAGTALILSAAGIGAGIAHGLHTHNLSAQIPQDLGAALVQLPAALVAGAIAAALFGLAPRLILASWAAVILFLLLGQIGPVLNLNQWVMDISPFTHVPKMPGASFSVTPIAWMIGISAGMTAAGLAGFRRRDLDA